jgi:hypothetical protein
MAQRLRPFRACFRCVLFISSALLHIYRPRGILLSDHDLIHERNHQEKKQRTKVTLQPQLPCAFNPLSAISGLRASVLPRVLLEAPCAALRVCQPDSWTLLLHSGLLALASRLMSRRQSESEHSSLGCRTPSIHIHPRLS